MNRYELTFILVISGLLALSFPPFPLGFLAPIAVITFLFLIQDTFPGEAFRVGYWIGLIWGSITLYWIGVSSLFGAILLISLNAVHYALVAWLYAIFRRKNEALALIFFPFAWVALEYLRNFSELRFNWLSLAYTQTYYLHMIQISEITGFLFLSLLILMTAVATYAVIKYRTKLASSIFLGVILAIMLVYFYGTIRLGELDKTNFPLVKAGFVQPNVDPYKKWDPKFQSDVFDDLIVQSQTLIDYQPDIIIWPETATPFYLRTRYKEIQQINNFLDKNQVFLLTGTPDYRYLPKQQDVRIYNSAFFFRPGQLKFEIYNKMALVPGSETIPFKRWFPFLRKLDVGGGDYFPGKNTVIFDFKIKQIYGIRKDEQYESMISNENDSLNIKLSTTICYESVFPNVVRKFVMNGANLLSVITNDGWFGSTSGPYQHARYAIYRAVENRVSIIRCANTGISGFIDLTGRFRNQTRLNSTASVAGTIPVGREITFYTRHGDWLGQLCLIISVIIIFYVLPYTKIFRSYQYFRKRSHE
jgi:apolipoprotein N-acyltransferase